jgi:hypothetical protein
MKRLVRRFIVAVAGVGLLVAGVYLAAGAALMPLRQENIATPRIFAYRDWQSVGMQLQAGDLVTIWAEGEWLYTPGEFHGPEGHARYPAPTFYPVPYVAGGALIGRVGEGGEPFYVGKRATVEALQAGRLYLRIDDDILSDNEGWVEVRVQVQPSE